MKPKKYKSQRRLKVKPPKVIAHKKQYSRLLDKINKKKILKEVLDNYKDS